MPRTGDFQRSRHGARYQSGTAERILWALRGRCADLHSRRAQGPQGYYRTGAFAIISKRFPTEANLPIVFFSPSAHNLQDGRLVIAVTKQCRGSCDGRRCSLLAMCLNA